MAVVVTQLIVDASGARQGVAEFEASMARAKQAAVDGGNATASSFEQAQRRWVNALGTTDPLIKAQIKMQQDLARQQAINTQAVQLGIATQEAAAAQLDKVRQKHEANIQAIKASTGQLTLSERAMGAFGQATSGVSGQLIALSAGAGPVGTFLAALGPWGLAAAVALGGLSAALHYVEQEAARMGDKAIAVRQFTESTGLAVAQLSALRHAGAEFGIEGETITRGFERLTFQLNDARRASGSLYDEVRQVSGGLAEELRSTTTTSQGIDVLARAWRNAGNEAQKAAIARGIFGRQGAAAGPVLGAIADAGGLDALAGSTKVLKEATDEQNKAWAKMRAETVEMEKQAKNILASIFTEEGLRAAHLAAELMRDAAVAAKDLASQKEGLSWWQRLFAQIAENSAADIGATRQEIEQVNALFAARQRLLQGKGGNLAANDNDMRSWQALSDAFRGAQAPADQALKTFKELQDAAAGDAKLERERIGLLGSAATIEEQRIAREKDLKSALLDNRIAQVDYNRAIEANNIDAQTRKNALRISQLGEMATVQEVAAQKERELQKAIRDGAAFSDQELAGIRARNQLLAENGKLENQLAFDRAQIFRSPVDQSIEQTLRAAGIPPESERAAAIRDYMRMTAALKEVHDAGVDFAQTFVHGLMSGQNVVQSLVASLDKLAQKMADKAIVDLLSGNFEQAAFDAVIAIGAFIASALGKESEKVRKAKADWKEMQQAAMDFVDVLAGHVQGDLTKRLNDTFQQGVKFYFAALAAGDFASAAALYNNWIAYQAREIKAFNDAFVATVKAYASGQGSNGAAITAVHNVAAALTEIKGFITDAGTAGADVAKATQAGRQYLLTLITGGQALSDVASKFATITASADALRSAIGSLGGTVQQVADAVAKATADLHASFTGDLQRQLNEATGQGFVNSLLDLITKTAQNKADAALFGNVDTSLIDQLFAAQAQQIVDQAGLVGTAFENLITKFPQLVGVVHESTAALTELQSAQNAAAKSIVDYVSNLRGGAGSNLSPAARLAASQSQYNATLGLAQGGNADALQQVTKDFENYRAAAQAMFGSTAAYQNILNTGINQLLALPAVATATDPVVTAMRDVLTAIQAGNQTGATIAANTASVSLGVSGVNSTAGAIAANTNATSTAIATNNSLTDANNLLLIAAGATLTQIQSLNDTSRAQLQLLNQQLAGSATTVNTPPVKYGVFTLVPGSSTTVDNTLVIGINKIVINTKAAVDHLAFLSNHIVIPDHVAGVVAGAPTSIGLYAQGGVIPPGGLGIIAEHSPLGPQLVRAGREPITVSPFGPANDNNGAEIRALTAKVDSLERTVSSLLQYVAELIKQNGEKLDEGNTDRRDGTKRAARAMSSPAGPGNLARSSRS
jgi:hypothetical protein